MLARYEWLWQRYGDRPEYARRTLTIKAGFGLERALIAFWEEVARTGDVENAHAAPTPG